MAVASFRLAVDRDFKDRETGERKADFINVVAWRQTGEFVSRFLTKGRLAVVEGKLQTRDYTDRDGNRRYATEVVADNVYFGDSRRDGEGGYAPAPQAGRSSSYGAPAGNNSYPPSGGRLHRGPRRWISLLISPTTMGSCLSDPLLRRDPARPLSFYFKEVCYHGYG